jgi:hypothetical protein
MAHLQACGGAFVPVTASGPRARTRKYDQIPVRNGEQPATRKWPSSPPPFPRGGEILAQKDRTPIPVRVTPPPATRRQHTHHRIKISARPARDRDPPARRSGSRQPTGTAARPSSTQPSTLHSAHPCPHPPRAPDGGDGGVAWRDARCAIYTRHPVPAALLSSLLPCRFF